MLVRNWPVRTSAGAWISAGQLFNRRRFRASTLVDNCSRGGVEIEDVLEGYDKTKAMGLPTSRGLRVRTLS